MKTPRSVLSPALCSAFALLSLCAAGFSQTSVPAGPVATFTLTPPADPPSGPAPVAPVASVNGSYSDSRYLGGNVDMATDESGKVLAVGSVSGYEDKKEGDEIQRTGAVKTINGIPHLVGASSINGTYGVYNPATATLEQRPITGSGQVKIPLGPAEPASNNVQPVTVISSHSGKLGGDPDQKKTDVETLRLDKNQVDNIVDKAWSIKVVIGEKTDAKGKPYIFASVDLKKPDGTRTIFADKKLTYSEVNGYSFALAKGSQVDPASGAPKLDAKGKPLIDKKSKVKFSKLLLKKFFDGSSQPYWEPAAGGIYYKFLGQKGFGQLFNFDVQLPSSEGIAQSSF